jgi:ABC-type Fe3+ transport system permease subunit
LGKNSFTDVVVLPLMLSPFVAAIGVHHILGVRGMLYAIFLKAGIIDAVHLFDWLSHYKLI